MTFHLCGPTPLSDANYTQCATGGTLVGAVKPVSGPSPSTVPSDAYTITSAGRYCWRGDYSGDATAGVPASSDSSVDECFSVTPLTPAIARSRPVLPERRGDRHRHQRHGDPQRRSEQCRRDDHVQGVRAR